MEDQEDRSGWAQTTEEVAERLSVDVEGLRALVREMLREMLDNPAICAWCGWELSESQKAGNPPRTCSGRCRTALSRERKHERAAEEAAKEGEQA